MLFLYTFCLPGWVMGKMITWELLAAKHHKKKKKVITKASLLPPNPHHLPMVLSSDKQWM